ncbi:4-hydroxy-tetrahydrodipicolinate reductase [Ascidiimonas sp. W6]|uniref:4-hydroxy-tetrahydrodipicolinate reductase n=1 Tax=Ascidiimonas meishanensis TaxID=3128903 RepID=UPI0030EF7280
MKIALLGYGKMGRTIERLAIDRGHEIVLKVDKGDKDFAIDVADVAIDFSLPEAAFGNISMCFENKVPVVSGTTGWLKDYEKAVELCTSKQGAFIYASNFSLGVNLFFELNKQLAQMMQSFNEYKVGMEEIHHTKKLDAPSGTAITLAEGIIEHTKLTGWQLGEAKENEIPIVAKRIEDVPGTHSIFYESIVDQIEIKHTAYNRDGFALGAVIAAEWLVGKTGVYGMKDVLNLG